MKQSFQISLLVAGVCAALPLTSLLAQAPAPDATPSVSAPANGTAGPAEGGRGAGRERMRAAMASLTPAEREELRTARQKALQDPAVEEARKNRESDPKAFKRAMHQAVLKADPNIKPILEKMHPAGMHRKDFKTN